MRLAAALFALAALPALPSAALPRFAARTGADCRLCHVSPSGGGLRTRYGSAVFQQLRLPIDTGGEADDSAWWSFDPRLTDWLTVGGDLRTAYLFSAPERAVIEGEEPEHTSTFFLMQADLYTGAQLGRHARVVLDVGVYAGFEAWLLLQAASTPSAVDAYLKIGRFVPAFGLRDANHDLFTRATVGFGPSDRDTGLELTGVLGPLTASLALVNGTFGDGALDGRGTDHRSFEKAVVSRLSLRVSGGPLHLHLGASMAYDDNVDQASPLFRPAIGAAFPVKAGVDELRVSGHLLAGLGPLTYQGEAVYVTDRFTDAPIERLHGYAAAQELAIQVVQGVELLATFEWLEPDAELAGDTTARVGGAVEVFVGPYFEVRAMGRHSFSDVAASGDVTDVSVFAHAAF